MPVICQDIIRFPENKYPKSLAEDFDNVRLIVGDPEITVSRVLICLDINVDIRHHHAIEGIASGINIIDGSHCFTEIVALTYIAQFITSSFDVECSITKINTNPFQRV